MYRPLISIITVCYQAERIIEDTMLSVLSQTYDNLEYIIIDGNSSDNTRAIIEGFKSKYPNRIIKVISEPDRGIYDAMNKGIKISNGDWINMMNAGDRFSNNDIIKDIVESGLMKSASFIYSDFIADDGKKRRRIIQSYDKGKILHQSSIYKKELHNVFGMYYVTHPYIVSDYLFFLQVPKECYAKYDNPISINNTCGISMQGYWMEYGRICSDYMMHKISENRFIFKVLSRFFINRIKTILHIFR